MTADAPRAADRPSRRSIRRRLLALLATLGTLVAGLLVVTSLQLRASGVQARAENQRNQSFRVADSMRQSSNELTLMIRLYVSTGEARYRDYYNQILAIRAGRVPRPLDYDSSFWDRVLAEGTSFVQFGAPESLVDHMRAAHFTEDEFEALDASLRASNDLADVELDVMDDVASRIAKGVDSTYLSDVAPHYHRLVDADYLMQKGVIMHAISDFVDRVDARTRHAADRATAESRRLSVLQFAILGLIALAGVIAMVRASRLVVRPLVALAGATEQFAAGDYERRVHVEGVSELEALAATFNAMASAVESDVRRRELAEREALDARITADEANRAKSTFVAAMSHEIRTPMIGVTGMLEVLAQTDLTPDQHSMVSTAQGSAQVLLQIIGDILDFSKIEAGKLELAPAPFVLRQLITAATQTFFHTASAKGLLLSCEVDDDVAPAHVGDALRIRQILSNFISNAVKFTPSGSISLAVRVLADDTDGDGTGARLQRLELSVADTGIGVAPDKQRELFQEFTQADATTAGRSGGTGLGLVICRRLAALMGGDVRMQSTPGRGTTLYLTVALPVADPRDVEAGAGEGLGDAPLSLRRSKPTRLVAERDGSLILLAEDHPINRRVLVHQLGIIGFHVDTAEDGEEALELFAHRTYGVVLTDLNMPVMDGFELAQEIRRHEAATGRRRTPIVALSANVAPGEAERSAAAGMDDFVAKPAPMAVLAGKLRRWLPDLAWATGPAPEEPGGGNPPTSDTEPCAAIDGRVLDELSGGDADLATTILADYVESLRSDVAALSAAMADASGDGVRRQAHRIKGASRMVGADNVATIAARLEAAALEQVRDWPALHTAADDLEVAVAQVVAMVARQHPAPDPSTTTRG